MSLHIYKSREFKFEFHILLLIIISTDSDQRAHDAYKNRSPILEENLKIRTQ